MKHILLILIVLMVQEVFAATSSLCPGEEGYYYTNYRRRNPQQGGFVAHTAYVDDNDDLFLAKTAAVCENGQLYDRARVLGRVVIKGNAEVYGRAIIKGNAVILGESQVHGSARIQDQVQVVNSEIRGEAKLSGWYKSQDEILTQGKHYAPEFSQADLDAQHQAKLAERRAESKRRQRARNQQAQAEKDQRQNAKSEKIKEKRRKARAYLTKAKDSLHGYGVGALRLEYTASSIWVKSSGVARMKISSEDPCTVYFYGKDQHGNLTKKVKTNLRYDTKIYKPNLSVLMKTDNLSYQDRSSFNTIKAQDASLKSLDDYIGEHYARAERYYSNENVTKVKAYYMAIAAEEVSFNDKHFENDKLSYNYDQRGALAYFRDKKVKVGLAFATHDDMSEFYSNLKAAYNNYCPSKEGE